MHACKLVLMQIATSILLVIFLSTGIETVYNETNNLYTFIDKL